MLTPQDIERKQFAVTSWRRGYDQDEVDDFIDLVAEEYASLWRRAQDWETRSHTPPHGMVTVESATRLLEAAEAAAEKCKADAQSEAEILLGNTRMDATNIIEQAHKDAEAVVRQGTEDRHRVIGELEDKRAQLQEKVDELTRAEADIVSRIRTALERWGNDASSG